MIIISELKTSGSAKKRTEVNPHALFVLNPIQSTYTPTGIPEKIFPFITRRIVSTTTANF